MEEVNVRVIDAHSHFLADAVLTLLRSGEYPHGHVEERDDGKTWVVCTSGLQFPVTPLFTDVEAKLTWMDQHGIDISVTSTCAPLFLYELPVDRLEAVCREVNDAAARMQEESGKRVVGMATVPITAPELAAGELHRACAELGLSGVEIGTSVGDTMLDDPGLDIFYDAAEELGATIFLHPYVYMLGLRTVPGFERFFLLNSVGNMLETHLAAARMTLGGVFDRHPRLRIQLSHGGGSFPYQLARLNHTYAIRPQIREAAKRPPFDYMPHFLFDTVLYDSRPLRFLVDLAGANQVVFGTDHPFDIADLDGRTAVAGLDAAVAARVLAANAAAAYGL
jgi:aminocarboxymuconate-semialdehyde decarboxylase